MIPWPDTWVYLFAGDEDAAHGMDADGGELRLAPFGDTYVLVSVLFSSLGMAFRFAKIEYITKVSARKPLCTSSLYSKNLILNLPPLSLDLTVGKIVAFFLCSGSFYPMSEYKFFRLHNLQISSKLGLIF